MSLHDIITKNSFHCLEDSVALISGRIENTTNTRLLAWLKGLQLTGNTGTLLLDSKGGIVDIEVLVELVKTPLHIHVLENAQSWAMCMALCASHLTANPDSTFMNHGSRWDMMKSDGEIAEDQHILDEHNYKVSSIISSVLPAGSAKTHIIESMYGKEDTYFKGDWLWEKSIIDQIAPVDLKNLEDRKMAEALEELYNKGDL